MATFALRLILTIITLPVGNLASFFTEEQSIKITHRKHYVKKQKEDTTSSKDDELDLLGDDNVESFTGRPCECCSQPTHPQPLPFESLSIKTPAKTVPPTLGNALQQKIGSNLEKFPGKHT